jgi:hypothetical protein
MTLTPHDPLQRTGGKRWTPAVREHRSSAGSTITASDTGDCTMSFTDWTSAHPTANVVPTSQPLGAQAGLAHAPRC